MLAEDWSSLHELGGLASVDELGLQWSSLHKLSLLHLHLCSLNESSSWCATSFDDNVTLMNNGVVGKNVLLLLVLLS